MTMNREPTALAPVLLFTRGDHNLFIQYVK